MICWVHLIHISWRPVLQETLNAPPIPMFSSWVDQWRSWETLSAMKVTDALFLTGVRLEVKFAKLSRAFLLMILDSKHGCWYVLFLIFASLAWFAAWSCPGVDFIQALWVSLKFVFLVCRCNENFNSMILIKSFWMLVIYAVMMHLCNIMNNAVGSGFYLAW